MNKIEFDLSIDRLKRAYSVQAYPHERVSLLYDEFKSIHAYHWSKVIDEAIKSRKTPPMVAELRNIVAELKEGFRARQKVKESNEAKEYWDGGCHGSESTLRHKMIRDRINGELPDPPGGVNKEWQDFKAALKGLK